MRAAFEEEEEEVVRGAGMEEEEEEEEVATPDLCWRWGGLWGSRAWRIEEGVRGGTLPER